VFIGRAAYALTDTSKLVGVQGVELAQLKLPLAT
jgi:hypothetical protein